jgi:hypothetical protein
MHQKGEKNKKDKRDSSRRLPGLPKLLSKGDTSSRFYRLTSNPKELMSPNRPEKQDKLEKQEKPKKP